MTPHKKPHHLGYTRGIETTTTRSTTSPSQVPDTDEVRNDNISPSPLTGCTKSLDSHPARYKGTPPAGVDRNMNLPDSNHEHTPFGKAKMPSELLDDSTCDYTTDTTDNNPLESSVTPHHKTTCDNSFPSTLDILVDLGGDESATGVNNQHPSDDRDVREAGRVDPIIRDHTEKPPDKTLDRTIGPLDSSRTSNVATENHNVAQTPNKRASKRVRGLSGSPDKSYKKTLDENGVIRETVEDIPDTVRNPFFKIRYVPGTIDELEIPNTPPLTVSQQAERKKTMLGRMTGDQAKRWHEGRNSRLTAERLRGRYSWIDQAVENDVNTHWAFGTIGLPSWLLTNEDSVNQIFQIRSNAAREVMNIARNHLHLEHVKEKQKSTKILEDLERELDADLAATSRQLVSMHTERHLSSFTDELSTRREWLIGHQPSITETISMKPDGRRRDALGNLPPELMSDDDLMSAPAAQPTPETNTSQKKSARKRQKKRKRTGNQQPVPDKTVTPTASGTAANPPTTVKTGTNGRPQRTYIPPRNPPRGPLATRDGESDRRRDPRPSRSPRHRSRSPHRGSRSPRRHTDDHRGHRTDPRQDRPTYHRSSHSDRRDDGKDYRARADHRPSSGDRRGNDDRSAHSRAHDRRPFQYGQRDHRDSRRSGERRPPASKSPQATDQKR